MGIRETLNKSPAAASAAVVAIIALILGIVWFMGGASGPRTSVKQKVFFTIDDGKSWFVDSAAKIPPFQKDGKEAVLAQVYSCDGKQFVAYMKRFTPQAKEKLEANSNSSTSTGVANMQFSGTEVKAPGGAEWYKQTDERAVAVMQPKCKGKLERVEPPGD